MKKLPLFKALLFYTGCSLALLLSATQCTTTAPATTQETSPTRTKPETAKQLPLALYENIEALLTAGKTEQAVEQAGKAWQANPASLETGLLYARLLLLGGHTQAAKAQLTKLLDRQQEHPDILYSLSVLAGVENRTAEQKALLEKILAKAPAHADALASLGELYFNEKKNEKAGEYFSRALQTDPENIIATMGSGRLALAARDYKTATETFSRIIAQNPAHTFAYIDRAEAYKQQGNYQQASADYTRAMELDPDYYWNYVDRGKLFLLIGNKSQAQADFTKAVNIRADYFLAHVYLAGLYYEQADWEKALVHYQQVEKLREDYYFIYRPLGMIQYKAKNWEEAARLFAKAHRYERKDYSYPLLAALAYKKAGATERAVRYLQDISKQIPTTTWQHTVAQYLIRPEHEVPMLNIIKQEKSPLLKKIQLFYLASQYLLLGKTRAAQSYFLEATSPEQKDVTEQVLAAWELEALSASEVSLR